MSDDRRDFPSRRPGVPWWWTDEEWLEDHRDQQVQREAAYYADPEVTRG